MDVMLVLKVRGVASGDAHPESDAVIRGYARITPDHEEMIYG
jgi:hypothetical protein